MKLPHSRHFKNVPFDGHVKFGQIDTHLYHIAARSLVHVAQINLEPRSANRLQINYKMLHFSTAYAFYVCGSVNQYVAHLNIWQHDTRTCMFVHFIYGGFNLRDRGLGGCSGQVYSCKLKLSSVNFSVFCSVLMCFTIYLNWFFLVNI